ncbi:hypothetical protein [Phaeacidiphilus oryzae]|uniref:hypothetical protein n=1 Tax=Phaeacidiphilus oryzae TaxID=348818 RepID=UPI0007C74469|nr:hypothetical protein [Phaeacidiphilus oryzae]
MTVVAIAGGPGAPGATTTALALLLAWPLGPGRRVLLAECDPDGGAVLAGALEGRVEAVYGLRNLAVADRRGLLAETLWSQLVDLSPDGEQNRLLLPGLTDPAQAPGLAYTWEPLARLFQDLHLQGCDVLVDLGRSGAHGASSVLARRADVVLTVLRSTLRGVNSARPRVSSLHAELDAQGTGADAHGLLVVGEGPYPVAEVARRLGAPALGLLPYLPKQARVLSDGGEPDRRFVRSELMRAARSTADAVRQLTARRRARLGLPDVPPQGVAQGLPQAPPPGPGQAQGPANGRVHGPAQAGPYPHPQAGPQPQAGPNPQPGPQPQRAQQDPRAQAGRQQPPGVHQAPGVPQAPGVHQPSGAGGPGAGGPAAGSPAAGDPAAPLAGLAPHPAPPQPGPGHPQVIR